MSVLENIEPRKVFYYFEELCQIPHGSRNTKQISDYCVQFAKDRGLTWYQDASNNVIIIKEAAKGYENADAVILQGHLDMVCEKEPDSLIDMEKDGLILQTDGDKIYAKGTTLGGDDGIAIAMSLAIMDSDIPHPRLEAVFTGDEEIGMLGAGSIDISPLQGKRMLNIDSEEEGVFTVSCAGGNVTECILPLSQIIYSGIAYEIKVDGLQGGHSGIEINKGRGNANVIMGRLLQELNLSCGIQILSVNGGLKDNAIPRDAMAVITVEKEEIEQTINAFQEKIQNEFRTTDAEVHFTLRSIQINKQKVCDNNTTQKIIFMLTCLPNGIQGMSADIKGLVETSLNMGIVTTTKTILKISFCVRSSVASLKEMLTRRLKETMNQIGGTVNISGDYFAWEYRKDSPLRDLMIEVFKDQYGKEPKIEAVHAGVECGIFAGKIPELDCVSFGPDLTQIHTVRESMSISSVQRVYQFILEILKRMK